MSELLPCPFCGGEAEMSFTAAFWIECTECHAEGSAWGTKKKAIAAWNTRGQQAKPVVDDAMVARFIGHGYPSGGWENTCIESVRRGLKAALSTGEWGMGNVEIRWLLFPGGRKLQYRVRLVTGWTRWQDAKEVLQSDAGDQTP